MHFLLWSQLCSQSQRSSLRLAALAGSHAADLGTLFLWASARTAHIATRVCTKTAASSARWCEQAAPQPPQYRVVHPASGVKIFVQSHAR